MSTTEEAAVTQENGSRRRRLIVYAVVLVTVFLIGLVPMWLVARGRATERDAAQHQLRLCQLENTLSSAALDARRGDYEPARVAASNFFTSLHEQVDLVRGPSDLTSEQREALRPLLNQRDDLITLLARSDPAAADRLAEIYTSLRKTMATRN